MGATARLTETALRVDCGQEATARLVVRNTGTVVDEFAVTVLGESGAWSVAEPAAVSLFPDAEETVSVRFRPPRSANTPQGRIAFGVQVVSREDPAGSVVEEGTVDVAPFVDVSAEIVPRTSHGRFRGAHEVAIDNRGNSPVEVALVAKDPDDALRFRWPSAILTAPPGSASFRRFSVSAGGALWRGTAQTVPFTVSVEAAGQPPIRLDASFQREPMIPAWLPRAIAVCFALALASLVAWLGVVKPYLDGQQKANEAQNQNIDKLAHGTGITLETPAASSSAGPSPTAAASSAAPVAELGNPVSVPMTLVVKPGDTPQTTELTFPKGGAPSLSIASILVQNPYNDAGVVSLLVHEEGQPDEDATTLVSQALLNQTMPNVSLTPPKTLAPTETLRVSVLCSVPGSIPQPEGDSGKQSTNCQVTVLVGGYVRGGAAPPTPKKLS